VGKLQGQTYTYDADGNLTGNGTDTYVWNARNQLAAIKQGSTTIASFSYDPLGRRIGTDFNGNAASYLYDGLNAVQETHGSTATSILSGLAVDERFARTDLGGRTDFLSDALNSTIALTNSAGAIVEQYSYDPYGTTTASVSGFDNPYQYTGRENDGDGLYYYRARYYAPAMGRFISEDPLELASGSMNFYGYASGDPTDARDSTGLFPEPGELFIGGVTGATVGLITGDMSGDTGWGLVWDTALGGIGGVGSAAIDDPGLYSIIMKAIINGSATAASEKLNGHCLSASSIFAAAIASSFGDIAENNLTSAIGSGGGSIDQSEARFASFYGQTVSGELSVLWTSEVTGEPPNNAGLGWYIPKNSH
jgi:RHS repeat-associated protein